jgi:tetratricopeptide (TPR) repeat protein
MNSTRALSTLSQWQRRFVPASGLAILLALLVVENGRARVSKPSSDPAEQADAFPASIVANAPDLQLTPERTRQADALASYILGNIAEDNSEDDTALQQYRHTLALDPSQTELAIKVATELARRGNVAEAINVLKDNLKLVPNNSSAQLFVSQLYSKYLKKDEIALKYAAKALEIDPGNFDAYLALYQLYAQTGASKKASEILDRAEKLKNASAKFWIQLGQMQARITMKEDGTCDPADLARLNATYQKALAAAPKDPAIVTRVADFFVISKQTKDAIPLYEQVLALNSDSDDPAVMTVRDKLAKCYRLNGQRDKAIAMFQQIVADNPDRYDSYESLGELYEEKGDLEMALATYAQSLKIEPNQPLACLRIANLYLKNNRIDEGIKILTDAHDRFPDVPRITYFLAMALSQAKQNGLAIAMFDEAAQAAQDMQQDMLDAPFYFSYGAAAEQAGQIEKAVKLMKKSIALDPANSAEACNYLGFMWVDRNEKLDEGGALIKRALQIEPENPAYLDSLGWYYYRKGQFDLAITQLLKACDRIHPEDAVVDEHVADTYSKLGDKAKALVYWQRAQAIDPSNKEIGAKIEAAKQEVTANPTAASPAK